MFVNGGKSLSEKYIALTIAIFDIKGAQKWKITNFDFQAHLAVVC
jgi:hypothetical protein